MPRPGENRTDPERRIAEAVVQAVERFSARCREDIALLTRQRDELREAAMELSRKLTTDLARTDLDCLKRETKDAWRAMIAVLEAQNSGDTDPDDAGDDD